MRKLLAGCLAFSLACAPSLLLAEPQKTLPGKPPETAPKPVKHGPMTFRLMDAPKLCTGCDVIVASGDIEESSAQDFQAFFDWNKPAGKKTYFIVDSPGGSVIAGWEIARRLRALSASVIAGRVDEHTDGSAELVGGECVSMCNSLVISGIERRLAPGTTFGIHQFTIWNSTFANLDNKVTVRDIREQLRFAAKWLAFSREMGADSRLVEAQFGIVSEKVDYLDPATLALWKVTTGASSTLPRVLREPGQSSGQLAVLGQGAAKKPAVTAAAKTESPSAGFAQVAAPPRSLSAVPTKGDRQWSAVTPEGDRQLSTVDSQADFARVTFGCSPGSAPFLKIELNGIPEERQKLIAQQIISGSMTFSGRPVDVAQSSFGFGSNFWVKFSLMRDQFNAFIALHGQVALIPMGLAPEAGQKIAVNFQTSGFEPMMIKARQACMN